MGRDHGLGLGRRALELVLPRDESPDPHAYQVFRPQFDELLLRNSQRHGVDVREGHRVLEVELSGQERMGVRVAGPGGESRVTARFVVDASGQAGLIGRALGLREPDERFQNLAVYGYFEGCERLPGD